MYPTRKVAFFRTALAALTFCILTVGGIRSATMAAQGGPPAQEDFGRYLGDHQPDLAPFFFHNGNELLGEATPLLLQWMGRIIFIALAVGWGLDVLLARGFANLFAPDRDRFRPSFVYASVRLLINVVLLILLESLLIASIGNANLESIVPFLIGVFGLISAGFQVSWTYYFYRTPVGIAVLFYLTLVVVHGFLTFGIAVPLSRLPASAAAIAFVNQTVTPKIEAETEIVRQQLASITPDRDKVADEANGLKSQIDEAKAEQDKLRQEIDLAKNSEVYLYSQVVKVHAQGDLTAARDQLANLLTRFPDGPMTGLARGQLNQVTNEIAAQDAQTRQAAADKVRAAGHARTMLLARASHGQATLSELRKALIGKSPAEVSALFGQPSETASNRWGFSRQMVFNPLTNEKSGLAVFFADGAVQSVDYYYGKDGAE